MVWRLALGFLLWVGLPDAFAQDTVWRNAWLTSGQPYLMSDSEAVVRTTTGQLVVVVNLYAGDYQVTSMMPDGVVDWQINIGDFTTARADVLAGTDGSVFVGTPGATTKIDSSGHVVWYRNGLGDSHLALTADALYLGSCNDLSSLDIGTGATRWSVARGNVRSCHSGLGVDSAGNVYLVSQVGDPPYTPTPPVRLAKFDASGSTLWDTSTTVSGMGAGFLGVADGRVYINQGFDVGAYDAPTGATLWTRTQEQGWSLAGSPASPIASDSSGLHRLDAADGHNDWTQPPFSPAQPGVAQGDAAYFCVSGSVTKIDAATGAIDWSFDINTYSISCFGLIVDAVSVVAMSADAATGTVRIDTIDAASGNAVTTALAAGTQQAIAVYNAFVDQARIVQLGRLQGTSKDHLRSIDPATGSLDWEIAFSPLFDSFGPSMSYSGDSIIVTDYTGYSGGAGYYWVGSFARSDGSQRWSQYEYQVGQSDTWGSAPAADSHGDVFVAYSYTIPCSGISTCQAASLLKLSAADGSVLWHFDSFTGFYEAAPTFTLIDDDVLVLGGFSGALFGQNVARLSETDGSVTWTAAPLGNDGATAVAVNPDGTITLTGTSSRALLQASGAALWTDHPTLPCSPECQTLGQAELADGTTLYVGIGYDGGHANNGWVISQPLTQNAPAREIFVNSDAPPDVRKLPRQVIADGGEVWIAGNMRQRPHTLFSFLAKLDPVTLVVSDQQVLAVSDADAFAPGLNFDMLVAPDNGLLPADTFVSGDGAPVTGGAALFHTAISTRGDLALDLSSTDSAIVSTFRATVTYSGDAAVANVRLMLWRGGYYDADSLQCVTSNASNCVATDRSGYVEVTFDIQPGGSVTISGGYPVSQLTLYGSVAGPASLAEPTLGNNFASWPAANDVLFRNGFE